MESREERGRNQWRATIPFHIPPPIFPDKKGEKKYCEAFIVFRLLLLPFQLHGQTHNSKITSLLLPVRSVPYGQPERKRGPFSPHILAFLVLFPPLLEGGRGYKQRRRRARQEAKGP